jgi:DNA-binding transcriptional LysR family regulator
MTHSVDKTQFRSEDIPQEATARGGPYVATVDFRQFRYFIAVAEELHFGRAAERLHIAQSGLSQQIMKLERSVGVQLLTRDRRSVELTKAGLVFLDHARQAVELADRAVTSALMAAERGKRGFLRVGTPLLAVPPIAGRVLQGFEDRFPDVEVELYPRLHNELIDGITTYELDVALVVSPFKSMDPPPRYRQLGTYELVAVVPEQHRLAKLERVPRSELLKEPLLEWPRNMNPEMIDHIHHVLFGQSEHPQTIHIPELEEARREAHVANGEGILISGLAPGTEHHIPGVVVRHFDEPKPLVAYGVAWSSSQASPFVDGFLEIASEFADSELQPHPA